MRRLNRYVSVGADAQHHVSTRQGAHLVYHQRQNEKQLINPRPLHRTFNYIPKRLFEPAGHRRDNLYLVLLKLLRENPISAS
jgi:hypothetical protein